MAVHLTRSDCERF